MSTWVPRRARRSSERWATAEAVRGVMVRYLNALDDRNAEKCTSPMSVGCWPDCGSFTNGPYRPPGGRTTVLGAVSRSTKSGRRLGPKYGEQCSDCVTGSRVQ